MKRYLIFGIICPLIGGFLLLFVTTYQSGYWEQTSLAEVQKLFVVFAKTLLYAYLYGIVPSLMIGAIDDILCHVRRIGPVVRMRASPSSWSRTRRSGCCRDYCPAALILPSSARRRRSTSRLILKSCFTRRRSSPCLQNTSSPRAAGCSWRRLPISR